MAEFAPAFDAGGMGMDRLPGRIFLCFPFLPLDAPLPFMPEQWPISVQQESIVQPAADTDSGCLAFEDGMRTCSGEYPRRINFSAVSSSPCTVYRQRMLHTSGVVLSEGCFLETVWRILWKQPPQRLRSAARYARQRSLLWQCHNCSPFLFGKVTIYFSQAHAVLLWTVLVPE